MQLVYLIILVFCFGCTPKIIDKNTTIEEVMKCNIEPIIWNGYIIPIECTYKFIYEKDNK